MDYPGQILVLDRERRVRNAMTAVLRRHGWACESLADARHAVEVLRREPPDVLVVDLGVTAYRRLLTRYREKARPLPVIVAAGRPSVATATEALRVGGVAFLRKPVRGRELVEGVTAALEKARALRGIVRAQHLILVWSEWLRLLEAVLSTPGPAALPPGLLGSLSSREHRPRPSTEGPAWAAPARTLSPREQETLFALTSGLRPRQIARALGVTIHTARAHVKAVMKKLDVHSQVELLDRVRQPWPDDKPNTPWGFGAPSVGSESARSVLARAHRGAARPARARAVRSRHPPTRRARRDR